MGKIQVLGFEIANLIAAGEVVDRPASVVKELLENAIDAGAHTIETEVRKGGVSMIRVTDDGCGMTSDDLPVALQRHATSKIHSAADLDGITTLGFRGEALAAISSVSDIRILSKPADAPMGNMITAESGTVTDLCEVGCADGTTVLVENLFAKVPARRKFLKKDATETMAVSAMLEKLALSRPDIAFRFIADGNLRFSTVGDGNLRNVVYALYGRELAAELLAVENHTDAVQLTGYVGNSEAARNNRNYQNVFINGRYVKSKTVSAALERAFTSYIAPERFPVCFLFLQMDPALVDVNVHPAKLEVKFSDEQRIFETVYYGVKVAVESNCQRPLLRLSQDKPAQDRMRANGLLGAFAPRQGTSAASVQQSRIPDVASPTVSPSGTQRPAFISQHAPTEKKNNDTKPRQIYPSGTASTVSPQQSGALLRTLTDHAPAASGMLASDVPYRSSHDTPLPQPPAVSGEDADASPAAPLYRYIGCAFQCYLLLEYDGDLLVIDQHAAHERLLFEQLKAKCLSDGAIASQQLLLPMEVLLSAEEASAAESFSDDLRAVGFSFEPTDSGQRVLLTAIPEATTIADAQALFIQMTDELARGAGNPAVTDSARRERALYQVACKAAIKGGRTYDEAHIAWLCDQLLRLPDITVCPHGRPVAYRITKRELDRQFDRIK